MKRIKLIGVAAILTGAAAAPAAAQVPDQFTNLTVLRKDIGKRELLGAMREFSLALGVGCDHCHARQHDGGDKLDFASDDLAPKQIARGMLKLAEEINAKLPTATGRSAPAKVGCLTCHHGIVRPQSLEQALLEVVPKQGVEGVVARYAKLRGDYYGRGAYDFGPGALGAVAQHLAEERKDVPGALVVARLNVEYNPAAAAAHVMLGQLQAAGGDKAAARVSLRRAIELEPDNRPAQQALQRLEASE